MKRSLLTLVVALALVWPVAAQIIPPNQSITVIDSGTACVTAPTACATYALDNQTTSLTIGVAGTWTGTLTFEGTNSDGVWTSLLATNLATGAQAATTTASGLFAVPNAGVIKVRVRATAAITGTALITVAKGQGVARAPGVAPFGTGTAVIRVGGVLNANVTPASNGTTVETDLMTYSLPAGSLATTGQGVRITAFGTTAATGNTKTERLYFGATVVATQASAASATAWHTSAIVLRVTATTQTATGLTFTQGNTGSPTTTSPGETLAGAIVLKLTGQSSAASNDVTATGFLVEALP